MRSFWLWMIAVVAWAGDPVVGDLLVASRKSHDPELAKTVVLLIYAGDQGVMGLILNRPTDASKGKYFGGPLPLGVRALVRSQSKLDGSVRLLDDVALITGADNVQKASALKGIRVYSGHAGWTLGQLRTEVKGGLWYVRPADSAVVFDPHPESVWLRLMKGIEK